MKADDDQRRTERFPCKSPLVWSTLNGRSIYSARTIDHGERGLGLVTRAPLKAGMTIFFRADNRTPGPEAGHSCPALRGTGLACIRWSRRSEDASSVSYRVGAEYVEPYP